MDRDELLKIISDDELGLLNLKPKNAVRTSDSRLVDSFAEISDFFKINGRLPKINKFDMKETQLNSRLSGILDDPKKISVLRAYDEFSILGEVKSVNSLDDIFEDDDLGLLTDDAENIFDLKNVPTPKEINAPDFIARRKPCKDFNKFEHLFRRCQSDLSSGERKLLDFSEGSEIRTGDFFVLRGVMVYVAGEGKPQPTPDGKGINVRLHCVFENGTESNMLMRSLAARLYEDLGRRVSGHKDKLIRAVNEISEEDLQTGYIYVLRSKSTSPEIQALQNLYKIGFSRVAVEERIKNAEKEPTYLMAPVAIVTTYRCYNLNPQKLESILHHFFGKACLDLDVYDSAGRRCIPKEWFVAPIGVIMRAVELVVNGEIGKFRFDIESQEVVTRQRD